MVACDVDHLLEVEVEVLDDGPSQIVVSGKGLDAGPDVELRLDLTPKLPWLGFARLLQLGEARFEERDSSQAVEALFESPENGTVVDDIPVSPFFQELVVPRVDDEEVRLIADELFHEDHHAVAGVGNAAGIDDLVTAARVRLLEKQLHPFGQF